MNTFFSRRNDWLTISRDYKGFLSVARRSLEHVLKDIWNLKRVEEKIRCHYISCYQIFTNKSKFERAREAIENIEKHAHDDDEENPEEQPPSRKSRKLWLQQEDNPPPDLPEPSSLGILPQKCLICNKYEPVYVKVPKVKK